MTLKKTLRSSLFILALASSASAAAPTQAVFDIRQVGPDLVVTLSGNYDISGLTKSFQGYSNTSLLIPSGNILFFTDGTTALGACRR